MNWYLPAVLGWWNACDHPTWQIKHTAALPFSYFYSLWRDSLPVQLITAGPPPEVRHHGTIPPPSVVVQDCPWFAEDKEWHLVSHRESISSFNQLLDHSVVTGSLRPGDGWWHQATSYPSWQQCIIHCSIVMPYGISITHWPLGDFNKVLVKWFSSSF